MYLAGPGQVKRERDQRHCVWLLRREGEAAQHHKVSLLTAHIVFANNANTSGASTAASGDLEMCHGQRVTP